MNDTISLTSLVFSPNTHHVPAPLHHRLTSQLGAQQSLKPNLNCLCVPSCLLALFPPVVPAPMQVQTLLRRIRMRSF